MNNIKKFSFCLIAFICTTPLLAMHNRRKNYAAPAEKSSKDDLLASLKMTMLYVAIARADMNHGLDTMATGIKTTNEDKANPSETSAPAAQTTTITVGQALEAIDAEYAAMQKLVSLTSELARTAVDNVLNSQDDDDSDDLDDNQGEISNNNNNNTN